MTSRSVRWLRDRLGLRGGIALCLIVAAALAFPRVLSSRIVSQRRATRGLERALAHLKAGELHRARSELRAVLRLQPANADARSRLAATELALGNREIAFLEFQTLTEMQPQDPNGWIGVAELMAKGGLLEAPEAALDKAIAVAPMRPDAHRLRGEIRFRVGRYHGARLDAEAAVAQAPGDPQSWGLLARSAALSDGAAAGIEAAERGIASVGRDAALLLPLASLMAERGRAREARKVLEEMAGARSGPGAGWNAQLALARVELLAGNRDAARRQLDELLAHQPGDEEAVALRAALDAAAGRLQPALARVEASLGALPTSRALSEVHARLQSARDDPGAAAALLAELMTRDLGPPPVPAKRLRGEAQQPAGDRFAALAREHWPGRLAQMRQALEAHMRQRNWTEAQRVVESARQMYPDTAFPPFLAGIVELARGDAEKAEKNLLEALNPAPRSPVVVTALAKAWSRKQGAAFAAQRLMGLAERDGGFAFARYMAARAYMDARDPVEAEAALGRGLALQPDAPFPYQHLADHYLELDRATDAMSILQKGLDRLPRDPDLQIMLAEVTADLGKAKDAIAIYADLLSRRPDLDVVEYRLVGLLASQDDDGRSRQQWLQLVRNLHSDLPSDPRLLSGLGWARYHAGDTSRGRASLEAAVNGDPDEPTAHYRLATIYARENEPDRMRRELKAALNSRRPFPERLDALRLMRALSAPDGTANATSPRR